MLGIQADTAKIGVLGGRLFFGRTHWGAAQEGEFK
jgi:hypothetical protein